VQYASLALGPLRLLLTRPDTGAYGNAILNMAWSFHLARAVEAPLYVWPTVPDRLQDLTSLECEGVPRARVTALRTALIRWACRARVSGIGVGTLEDFGPGGRGTPEERAYFGLDLRERCATVPLRLRLAPDREEVARRTAAVLGVDSRPLVTLHVREGGHAADKGAVDRQKDTARNARIETYTEAVDWLVSRGFQVVRIGDPTMTPFRRPGVVDLATSPVRSLALELWCVLRSAFLVTGDSGPFNLSVLTGVPLLGVNITHLIGAYPLRPHDRSILKHTVDTETGRALSLDAMLTPAHLKQRWVEGRYRFLDNSPQEIQAAVEEMVDVTSGAGAARVTAAQRAAREAMSRFLESDYGRRKQKGRTFYLGAGYFGRDWTGQANRVSA